MGLWFLVRAVRERRDGDGRRGASRRVLAAAVVIGLVVLVLSVVLGGTGLWAEYAQVIRAGTRAVIVDPRNAGIAALVAGCGRWWRRARADAASRRRRRGARRHGVGRLAPSRHGRELRVGDRRLARDPAGHLVPLPERLDPDRDRRRPARPWQRQPAGLVAPRRGGRGRGRLDRRVAAPLRGDGPRHRCGATVSTGAGSAHRRRSGRAGG